MRALITGATGMIGTHLANRLADDGWETYGLARSSAASRLEGHWQRNLFRCDILDRDALESVVRKVDPELVVHLAAQAFNGPSWEMEETTHYANYLGTVNVLRACRRFAPSARVLLACSSAEYGDVAPEDIPLKETRMLRPITPYGVSKAATEALGYQYFANYSMEVYLPRLFIHVGTGHPPATAVQNFARQLALIKNGKREPCVYVGDLSPARDFVDVRDGVEAIRLILENGTPGDPVNVCTGHAFKISEILDILLELSGLEVEVVQDPSLLRPSDEPLLLGDNSKLRSLGWRPAFTMRDTLAAVYQDWIERTRNEP